MDCHHFWFGCLPTTHVNQSDQSFAGVIKFDNLDQLNFDMLRMQFVDKLLKCYLCQNYQYPNKG